MKRATILLAESLGLLVWLTLLATGKCEEAGSVRAGVSNPLFALCFDLQDAKKRTLKQQAEMLAELGYDGAAHTWLRQVPERLKALDDSGLRLFQIYVRVSIDPAKPKYDPQLPEIIKLLAGRKTILGLLIQGGKPSDPADDDRAVAVIREIADLSAASGVRVALYPHVGDCVEKTSDAVRLVKKVDRKNVGVMFNLCHWLKVEGPENLESVLEEASPHLLAVTINGADPPPGNWDRLIQPLGSGSFDVGRVLELLREQDYTGPIGVQCFGIRGDAREHLKQSIAAWEKLSAEKTPDSENAPASGETIDPLSVNATCYVCHIPFVREEISRVHFAEKITCIKCHGLSADHANDEDIGATKPDISFRRGEIDANCIECHKGHDVPAHEVIARFFQRKLNDTEAVCTDCHGHHRIELPTEHEEYDHD